MSENPDTPEIPDWLYKVYEENGVDRESLSLDPDAVERAIELGEEGLKDLFERKTPSDTNSEATWRGESGPAGAVRLQENLARIAETGGIDQWDQEQPQTRTSKGHQDKPADWLGHELDAINNLIDEDL